MDVHIACVLCAYFVCVTSDRWEFFEAWGILWVGCQPVHSTTGLGLLFWPYGRWLSRRRAVTATGVCHHRLPGTFGGCAAASQASLFCLKGVVALAFRVASLLVLGRCFKGFIGLRCCCCTGSVASGERLHAWVRGGAGWTPPLALL